MDAGLTPRRIGRLIGNLDDQVSALESFITEDEDSGDTNLGVAENVRDYLLRARSEAENLASRLNAGERD